MRHSQTPKKEELLEKYFVTISKMKRVIDHVSSVPFEDRVATMLQIQALKYVEENPDVPVGIFAEHLHLSSSSSAQLIDRLANAGWIQRKPDTDDRRIIRLKLTENGRKELNRLLGKVKEKMSKVLSLLSEKDLADLIRIHTDLISKIEKQHETTL